MFLFLFNSEKISTRCRRIDYYLNVVWQSLCLVFNQIMADNHAAFFNCTPVGRASHSMMWLRHNAIHFSWLGPELLVCNLVHRGLTGIFLLLRFQ